MHKMQSHQLILLLTLIPLLLISCLCGAFLAPHYIDYFTSSSFSNFLWSRQITQELNNRGYPIRDVLVSDSDPPGFRIIDIQIGNLVQGEQQSAYVLVKIVHEVVIKTFETASYKPDTVDAIVITIFDYSSGTYVIGIDFETARKYQLGEISEGSYFAHWSFPENTPGIRPP